LADRQSPDQILEELSKTKIAGVLLILYFVNLACHVCVPEHSRNTVLISLLYYTRMKSASIIVGISAGIAGYKILDLIKILKGKRYNVQVVMTLRAIEMFGKSDFEKAAGYKISPRVIPVNFQYKKVLRNYKIDHIELAAKADLIVVAPATADIIGKIASGLADDLLTTTILASHSPVLICPSMNSRMWTNPAVEENIQILKRRNFHILSPISGRLACGTVGIGRLPDVEEIAGEIERILLQSKKLKGKKIMITAGGTTEPIDAVRMITNRSTGKMGAALVDACWRQGAQVLFLHSVSSVMPRFPVREEKFTTASNLEELMKKNIKNYDCLFHVAAISDFIPEKFIDQKIDSRQSINISFKPARKIINQVKKWNRKIKLVGFKAIYKLSEKEIIKTAFEKLEDCGADYIIANDVGGEGIGFAANDNEVYIVSGKGYSVKIPKAPKTEIAEKILNNIFPDGKEN